MRLSADCVCRTIQNETGSRPLVFLTSPEELRHVRNTIAVTLEGASCYGSSWRDRRGRIVAVKTYSDPIPRYPNGFDLKVCNGGGTLNPTDMSHLKKWRSEAT